MEKKNDNIDWIISLSKQCAMFGSYFWKCEVGNLNCLFDFKAWNEFGNLLISLLSFSVSLCLCLFVSLCITLCLFMSVCPSLSLSPTLLTTKCQPISFCIYRISNQNINTRCYKALIRLWFQWSSGAHWLMALTTLVHHSFRQLLTNIHQSKIPKK